VQTNSHRAAIGSIVLLVAILATPVWAADDASLEDLLIKKGLITQEELEQVKMENANTAPAQPDVAAAGDQAAASKKKDDKPRVEFKADYKGIRFETPDGKFKFGFGGRLQFDAAGFIEDISDMGSGGEIRRARIKAYGTVYHDWDYKLEVNFDTDLEAPLTDAWLRYSRFEPFTVTVGHQKVPFSQQSMTSSNWQVFQERALSDSFIDNVENGRRRLGLGLGAYGDQLVHWSFNGGLYGEGLAFAKVGNEDWGTAGRLTIAPLAEKRKVVAIGASVYYRRFRGPSVLRFDSKPESHIANTNMVDTGEMRNDHSSLMWNVEGSFVFGPFHGQGEYTRSMVDRSVKPVFDSSNGNFIGFSTGSNVTFDGWYVQAGWIITGESRPYDYKSGKYTRIMPDRDLLGAWEIALRYSRVDLQDRDITGGKEANVTVGLNWWTNRSISFRFNYVYARLDPNTSEAAATPANPLNPLPLKETVHAFMGRAQIVF
jgi:phosphate-selective porin OprO/OprP